MKFSFDAIICFHGSFGNVTPRIGLIENSLYGIFWVIHLHKILFSFIFIIIFSYYFFNSIDFFFNTVLQVVPSLDARGVQEQRDDLQGENPLRQQQGVPECSSLRQR